MKMKMFIVASAILLTCAFSTAKAQVVSVQTPRGSVYVDRGNSGYYGGRGYYQDDYRPRRHYRGRRHGKYGRGHVYKHGHRRYGHHRVYRHHRRCW